MSDTTAADSRTGICPNCGAGDPGRYCATCGQKQVERLVSARRMLGELLEDNFSLESRLPRTLIGLLFRPGFLSREYLSGRIARYVQPVRLYVVSTLVFFLVLSLVADFDRLWGAIGERVETAPEEGYVLLRTNIDIERVPTVLAPAARAWLRQEAEINSLGRREGIRVMYDATLGAVPPVVFLLVPLFALVLKALYRRRLFVEHAIFVLHFHALGFLLAAVALLAPTPLVLIPLFIWVALWLYLALRRVYGGSEGSLVTLAKYAVLAASYIIAFALTVFVVLYAAVMSV